MRHRLAGFTAGKQRGELRFLFSSQLVSPKASR
jgi:hypothetical protein